MNHRGAARGGIVSIGHSCVLLSIASAVLALCQHKTHFARVVLNSDFEAMTGTRFYQNPDLGKTLQTGPLHAVRAGRLKRGYITLMVGMIFN